MVRTSTTKRPRVSKQPEDRRLDFLRSAESVFGRKGFVAATVADICDAALVAKGTFYLYFESKEHVLGALWEEYVDGFLARTRAVIDEDDDWWPTMDRVVTGLVDHAIAHADLHRIVHHSANGKALELCRVGNERVVQLITEYVLRGAEADVFRAGDPALAFRLVYLATDALLDEVVGSGEAIDAAPVIAAVVELTHRALGDHRD